MASFPLNLISKVKSTGLRYSLSIACARLIPVWLLRCRRFLVFQIPAQTLTADSSRTDHSSDQANDKDSQSQIKWAESEEELVAAEELSGFRRSMSPHQNRACIFLNPADSTDATSQADAKEVVGVVWFAESVFNEPELGLCINLADGQFWIFSAYVQKEFRRQHVYRSMLSFATCELTRQNPRAVFLLAINPVNLRSMAAHRALGAEAIGRVFARRFLSFAGLRCRGIASNRLRSVRPWTRNWRRQPLKLELQLDDRGPVRA